MNQSLLNQILQEYDLKRAKAFSDAETRKKELLLANPSLETIENKISNLSIQTAKAILIANPIEREKLVLSLKKEINKLIKEKNAFIKNLSKDSRIFKSTF